MPSLFAIASLAIGNSTIATFAAFGSFAQMLFVGFRGSMGDRARSQLALALAGVVLVCIGTLCSQHVALATVSMAVVGFVVLFSGVVSSVLASASTGLLLAFILPVALSAPASSIPDRLAGWLMAGAAAMIAGQLLWPAPVADPLRSGVATTCRLVAQRLRIAVQLAEGEPGVTEQDRLAAAEESRRRISAMLTSFYSVPYRPAGLTTSARALVRMVDEIGWLGSVLDQSPPDPSLPPGAGVCQVKRAAAGLLDACADLLGDASAGLERLDQGIERLRGALDMMEREATDALPLGRAAATDGFEPGRLELVSAFEPSFRAQELAFVVASIARNVEIAVAADRRSWWERLLGRQPEGIDGPLAAVQQRARSHVDRHSVWLHNSVRGAIGLALAVLVADLSGVQHAFWVVLGTLSVLRSNALSTGQNVVKGLTGTVLGLIVGSLLILGIGTNSTVLWLCLPVAVCIAGFAPAAISFAAGQAAFSVTLLILFNLLAPAGWQIGLVRIEDVLIGSAVSLVVGVLFWPRGASAALRSALADAYRDSARYLSSAVAFGTACCDTPGHADSVPASDRILAAAAARRLDDAFRQLLNERGARRLTLAEASRLVTGVAEVRLAADAVLDLWTRETGSTSRTRTAARSALAEATSAVTGWYFGFADALEATASVPEAAVADDRTTANVVEAVGQDLAEDCGGATATAVRMLWTADHLDAVRRLQHSLYPPARTAARSHPQAVAWRPWHLPGRTALS
jgi:uncharacterized membrane protein YccC